jgi:catalase
VATDPDLVRKIVEALDVDGGSTRRRPVHTVGVGAIGFFEPSKVAPDYCIAPHFLADRTDVTMRFSNGIGVVEPHDGWSDVRGMAVRFHLEDGKATDLIAMTLPVFFAPDPETFLEFAINARPQPCRRQTAWEKIIGYLNLRLPMPDPYPGQTKRANEPAIAFADKTDWAKAAVLDASSIGAPVSYVREAYHAVHTFIVTGKDQRERYVRFAWQPVAGVLKMQPGEVFTDGVVTQDPEAEPIAEYLHKDLGKRLAKGVERFTLTMTIGETGDPFDDSTRRWPLHRRRVMMGTLTLERLVADQERDCENLSFNPCLLPENGIRASNDPVLALRRKAYAFSSDRRGAIPCPFSGGGDAA